MPSDSWMLIVEKESAALVKEEQPFSNPNRFNVV
jgi:hypothetical protein